ncbi:MAG: hypothetical protein HZB86_06970 [Deltaproteobacteria bacterium]|nr:hypothetical protein [Deltaproteobacteria bacterium]
MKKLIAITLAVALLAAPMAASADGGWSVAGKVLTGVIGLHILGNAIAHSHAYEPVYAPPPRTYYAPPPEQVWVPGRYETRYERAWVPGHWEIERYSHRGDDDDEDDDGYRSGRRVWVPGHYERVRTQVWIPGHWEERG